MQAVRGNLSVTLPLHFHIHQTFHHADPPGKFLFAEHLPQGWQRGKSYPALSKHPLSESSLVLVIPEHDKASVTVWALAGVGKL